MTLPDCADRKPNPDKLDMCGADICGLVKEPYLFYCEEMIKAGICLKGWKA